MKWFHKATFGERLFMAGACPSVLENGNGSNVFYFSLSGFASTLGSS
jgi:hypothetical protein